MNRIPGHVRRSFFHSTPPSDKPDTAVATVASSESRPDTPTTNLDEEGEVVVDAATQQARLTVRALDHAIQTGFQLATVAGPLCAEPMTGVCFIVEDVVINVPEAQSGEGECLFKICFLFTWLRNGLIVSCYHVYNW